jgi:hypothetical protein
MKTSQAVQDRQAPPRLCRSPNLLPKTPLFVLIMIYCTLMSAVETTGSIEVIVEDATHSVIPDVRITLVNLQTGNSRTLLTGPLGRFVFPSVQVGTYVLTAERASFAEFTLSDLRVSVNTTLTIPVTLTIEGAKSGVNVPAPVTTIEMADATLGQVFENKSLVDLPLNGRNFLQLTTLVPGSTPAIGYSQPFNPKTDGGITSSPQVNGSRAEGNNYLLDGADNNEAFLGSAAAVPSVESLQEFKIATHLFSAEFGAAGGAVVNVITKSGSNALHGSLYEFIRNDAFDARDYFSPEVPILKRNQFGGAIGGPIRKNKTFFFGSYEGLRERSAPTRTALVPTLLERQGDFSQSTAKPVDPTTRVPFPGNKIPIDHTDGISKNLLPFYPAPHAGPNQSTASPSEPATTDSVLGKVDHKVSNSDNLMVRFFWQNGDRTFHFVPTLVGALDVPNFPVLDKFGFNNWALTNSYQFSERTILQSRFSYNRANLKAALPQFAIDANSLGFDFPVTAPFHNIPLIGIAGFTAIGTSNFDDASHVDNVFVLENVLRLTRGRHLITAGGRIGATQVNAGTRTAFMGNYLFAGAASGNAFADFLLGDSSSFLQIGGDSGRAFRSKEFAYFIEDSFALERHLTLTFGLRHEIFSPLHDVRLRTGSFRPDEKSIVRPTVPTDVVFPGDPGVTPSTYRLDTKNLGPRIGFAWDPFGGGRTSVRAGYGIYYKPLIAFVAFQSFVSPSITNATSVFAPNFSDPFGGASPYAAGHTVLPVGPGTQVNTMDPNLKSSSTQHYSLSVQREVEKDYVVELGYVGSKSAHLLGTVQINPATFVTGNSTAANINARRPFQPYGAVYQQRSGTSANYNSVQASLTKRWSGGLSLLGSYTYSRAIDDVSVPQVFQSVDGQPANVIAANPHNLRAERAASSFDTPQTFTMSFGWALPKLPKLTLWRKHLLAGWQINGIFQAHSGTPFTIYDPSDPNVDGETSDRPDLVGNPRPAGFKRTVAHDFTAAARTNSQGRERVWEPRPEFIAFPGVSIVRHFCF